MIASFCVSFSNFASTKIFTMLKTDWIEKCPCNVFCKVVNEAVITLAWFVSVPSETVTISWITLKISSILESPSIIPFIVVKVSKAAVPSSVLVKIFSRAVSPKERINEAEGTPSLWISSTISISSIKAATCVFSLISWSRDVFSSLLSSTLSAAWANASLNCVDYNAKRLSNSAS